MSDSKKMKRKEDAQAKKDAATEAKQKAAEEEARKKDLEAANAFIDGVPKGDMVSPQVQELYMLVEYLAESTEKLKEQMEQEIPLILKNEMIIQFHEDRLIDLEERKNGNH